VPLGCAEPRLYALRQVQQQVRRDLGLAGAGSDGVLGGDGLTQAGKAGSHEVLTDESVVLWQGLEGRLAVAPLWAQAPGPGLRGLGAGTVLGSATLCLIVLLGPLPRLAALAAPSRLVRAPTRSTCATVASVVSWTLPAATITATGTPWSIVATPGSIVATP
jgi:hypothetical protein